MQSKKEINNQLMVVEPAPVSTQVNYNNEQVQLIKDTFAKGATDSELRLFIEVAERRGLDIFSRQIFLIERWDGKLKKTVRSPETSIDGYRVIADRTGVYVPGDEPTYTYGEDGKLKTAKASVKKWVQGSWHVISAEAHWTEYVALTKEGQPQALWKTKPHIMLAKCAEALALRKAFPAQLSGLYTREEMEQASSDRAEPPAPERLAIAPVDDKALDDEMLELSKDLLKSGMSKGELHTLFSEVTHKSKKEQLTRDEKQGFIRACKEELIRLSEVVDEDDSGEYFKD